MSLTELALPPLAASVRPPRKRFYFRTGKRLLDVVLALALLLLIAPVVGLLWVLVRRDGGPGFYAHIRIGRDGVPFACWKLRSMAVNAQALLDARLAQDAQARAAWRDKRKLDDDPRITRLGHVLRRWSLDELPQLWNVLRGEMSLVGPRPVTVEELQFYGPQLEAYLAQRPGVTGLWQVKGRRDGCYQRRVALDVAYGGDVRLWSDVRLLCQTGTAFVWPTGR